MTRRRVTGFVDLRSGEWRELIDPDGPATTRQLHRLDREGRLELVGPGKATPLTKAEAAAAIDEVIGEETT